MINPAIEDDLKRISLNDVNYADYIKENYIQIPDNATNGDMLKAVFGAKDVEESYVYQTITVTINGARKTFGRDWWNSPYKADKEGD